MKKHKKPSWDLAPSWANYLARDFRDFWWWFEYTPKFEGLRWWPLIGKSQIAGEADGRYRLWRKSCERRKS